MMRQAQSRRQLTRSSTAWKLSARPGASTTEDFRPSIGASRNARQDRPGRSSRESEGIGRVALEGHRGSPRVVLKPGYAPEELDRGQPLVDQDIRAALDAFSLDPRVEELLSNMLKEGGSIGSG